MYLSLLAAPVFGISGLCARTPDTAGIDVQAHKYIDCVQFRNGDIFSPLVDFFSLLGSLVSMARILRFSALLTGMLVGILIGFILIQPTDLTDMQTHLALLLDQYDISIPQLPQIDLPQMDFSIVEAEWRKLWSNMPEPWKLNTNGLEFTVGEKVAAEGLTAKHPVILIPGIISTVSTCVNSFSRRLSGSLTCISFHT